MEPPGKPCHKASAHSMLNELWSQTTWVQRPDMLPPWASLCPLWALVLLSMGWKDTTHHQDA